MAFQTINPENFAATMDEVLQTFNHNVVTYTDEAAKEAGKIAVKLLNQISPVRKTGGGRPGRYRKGWRVTQKKSGVVYVHNATDYRLTHLLEKGHVTYLHGVRVKDARAFPHISVAEQRVQEEFPKLLKRHIEMQR